MAIAGCDCNGNSLGNTGIPQGLKPFGKTKGLIMIPLRADDGTRNSIDMTLSEAAIAQAVLDLINNPDPSKRGYIYTELNNVTHTEADPTYETSDDGERFLTSRGIKTVVFEKWGVTEQFFNKTASACVDFGVMLIDECGNLKGQLEGTNLYPRPVNKSSFFSRYIDSVADAGAKVMFEMDYKITTSDGDQWMLPASYFEDAGFGMLELLGMIDVNFTVSNIAATEITFSASFDYGNAAIQKPWTGALVTDLTLYNNTTDASISLAGATLTESGATPGTYTLDTIPVQTAADVIELDAFRAATGNQENGFEGVPETYVAV